jgi:hypothetical protein
MRGVQNKNLLAGFFDLKFLKATSSSVNVNGFNKRTNEKSLIYKDQTRIRLGKGLLDGINRIRGPVIFKFELPIFRLDSFNM